MPAPALGRFRRLMAVYWLLMLLPAAKQVIVESIGNSRSHTFSEIFRWNGFTTSSI